MIVLISSIRTVFIHCFISAGLQNGRLADVIHLPDADHNEQTKETWHAESCEKIEAQSTTQSQVHILRSSFVLRS